MQDFWKSRTFWTALGIVLSNALVLAGALGWLALTAEITTAVLAVWNSILGVLALIFRWEAAGPLTMGITPRKGRK
ncbi:MAG: hypothetical protein BWX64_01884 [Acidobacteria bacterium ADurb.Bin051]|jgi:hypothetical protein|nr:MAG: hypothetical protein BWX64_01884 [Acidobacteria bacterium ADurb.Bin051]